MRFQYLSLLSFIVFAIVGCQKKPHDVQMVDALPAIFPDYIGVTVPANIAPLDFAMAADDVTTIDVTVHGSHSGELHASGSYADFDIDEWHNLLQQNKGGQLRVTVIADRGGQWTQYRDFTISISPHPIEAWGVTYRRIPPGYQIYGKMGIYQRSLSDFDETAVLENTRLDGMCINCHTPNHANPEQFVFHVRGEKGATVVHNGTSTDYLQAKNEFIGGSMVYPYWHPGGRYCAFSTNKTSQMFHTAARKRIEVYDSSSDVFIYDTKTRQTLRDTLIMKKYWAENCPAFSHDGRWLYFITARRQVYPTDYDKERYNLCRVAFDAATGSIGETVDTLVRAAEQGKSVSWPRPSYDGRYIMYTQADYGYFTVWHPESDLCLLDLQTGDARVMDEVNSSHAESYHNWDTGNHWFLFTSRRDDGLYTRLYFASIDSNGRCTKPFLLPQRDPKTYYRRLLDSYNTPDFTSRPVPLDARETARRINSGDRVSAN